MALTRLGVGSRAVWWLLLVAALPGLIGGCGGGASEPAPVAAALVVGQGQDQINIIVRSGGEIVLNGENSDGVRFPIESGVWKQTDNTGIVVDLVRRTALSRAVRIPDVTEPTTLTFEFTLTNTSGEVSVTPVSVDIVPVGDGNRFLEFFRLVPGEYTVVAALQPGTTAVSDVEFNVVQRQLVNYPDRTSTDGIPNRTGLSIGTPVTRSSVWLAGTVATWSTEQEAVNALFNPNVSFKVPGLDIDDINVQFDDTDFDRGVPDHLRDRVEHFVELQLTVVSGTCTNADGDPISCQDAATLFVLRTNGAVADSTAGSSARRTVAVDELKATIDPTPDAIQPESRASAEAYYAAVDPFDRRLTFRSWLANAGFLAGDGSLVDDGSVDHVLYINNYDLGFTRDMFVRRDPSGDVFAYVTNYPALRKATLREDVLATVAMEYGPPDQDTSQPRFVKFFVFVADGSGDQARLLSLNFDGRGEKWVPGACVPCHGGELRNLQPDGSFANMGDIDAAFLPWDLDSLLFVDARDPALVDPLTERGFELIADYIKPEDLAQFSLENQQDAFRRMNEAVLATMQERPGESERFGLVREMIHGWYGSTDVTSDDLPDVAYDGRAYIQEGWAEAGLTDVYHDVFARHCRICHAQAKDINRLRTLADLTSPALLPTAKSFLYDEGKMPNARLDMDRFWVNFRGGAVPAERLATALGLSAADAGPPGSPVARIRGGRIQTVLPRSLMLDSFESVASIPEAVNEDGIRLDGSISAFADNYAWRFTETPPGSAAQLVGDTTAKPAFAIDQPGRYVVELTVSNHFGPASSESIVIDASPGGPKLVATAALSITLPEAIPSAASQRVIGSGQLQWMDPDSTDANLTFTVTTLPARGTLSLTTFTQADINAGALVYSQTASSEGPTDSFTYTVSDESGNAIPDQLFSINITTRNDEPVLVTNGPLVVVEGGSASLSGSLQWSDAEQVPAFTLASVPAAGNELRNGAAPLGIGDSFTQADVDAGLITYVHDADNENPTDGFTYSVTDGAVVVGPNSFPIQITAVDDSPQLRTRNLTVEAARSVRLSGAFSNTVIPMADLAVLDADTTLAADFVFTLVTAPANGTLELRSGGATTPLGLGSTFTLADVITGGMATGLFYVNGAGAADSAPADDAFVVSIADASGPGTCETVMAGAPNCTISVDVTARTDGPIGVVNDVTLTGFLDPARARLGSTLTASAAGDVPWNDVLIDATVLAFTDTVTGDSGEVPLFYTVTSVPAGNTGFLKRGSTPLSGTGDAAIIGIGETFTDAEVRAAAIYFENREIGGAGKAFGLAISDGIFTVNVTLTVAPVLGFENDVGWVMDTRWDDALPNGGCGPAATRGCRDCHWRSDADSSLRGCAVSATNNNQWTNGLNGAAGGDIKCENLAAHYPAQLPDFPTTVSHSGGVVIGAGSFPHQILQNWGGDTDLCTP